MLSRFGPSLFIVLIFFASFAHCFEDREALAINTQNNDVVIFKQGNYEIWRRNDITSAGSNVLQKLTLAICQYGCLGKILLCFEPDKNHTSDKDRNDSCLTKYGIEIKMENNYIYYSNGYPLERTTSCLQFSPSSQIKATPTYMKEYIKMDVELKYIPSSCPVKIHDAMLKPGSFPVKERRQKIIPMEETLMTSTEAESSDDEETVLFWFSIGFAVILVSGLCGLLGYYIYMKVAISRVSKSVSQAYLKNLLSQGKFGAEKKEALPKTDIPKVVNCQMVTDEDPPKESPHGSPAKSLNETQLKPKKYPSKDDKESITEVKKDTRTKMKKESESRISCKQPSDARNASKY